MGNQKIILRRAIALQRLNTQQGYRNIQKHCNHFFIKKNKMGTYSIGEALNHLLEKSNWKPKVTEVRMRDEWEAIAGKTIAKYTRSIAMFNKTLTIYTDVAALKQELLLGKEQLTAQINEYFQEKVVENIVIK